MRKMQQHIVRGKDVFAGLEDSKRTWKLSVRSEGMEVHYTSMPARYEHLLGYFRGRYPGCKVKVIYEAGFKGFWLHDRLKSDGIDCVVTPPSRVTHERKRRVKNDKVDARRLATILEKDDHKSCYVPDSERREDRQVSRTLVGLQKDMTRVRNRIRKFLDFHGTTHDLPDGEWSEDHYTSLRDLPGLSRSLRLSLDTLLEVLGRLRAAADGLRKELKQLAKKGRYAKAVEILSSAPGIGIQTAIRMVLEWGEDWSRFGSGRKVGRYSGLICSEDSTGDTEHKGRITGESRGFVRGWLVESAWTAIRKDPALLDKYKGVWARSGSKKKAIVAVARKLVVRLRAILVTGQPYCLGVIE